MTESTDQPQHKPFVHDEISSWPSGSSHGNDRVLDTISMLEQPRKFKDSYYPVTDVTRLAATITYTSPIKYLAHIATSLGCISRRRLR
jgi:hypothetical protein